MPLVNESLLTRRELNRLYDEGEISRDEFQRLGVIVDQRLQSSSDYQPILSTTLPSRAELNQLYSNGDIDRKSYQQISKAIIKNTRAGGDSIGLVDGVPKPVVRAERSPEVLRSERAKRDALYGASWRLSTWGGFSFFVYLSMYVWVPLGLIAIASSVLKDAGIKGGLEDLVNLDIADAAIGASGVAWLLLLMYFFPVLVAGLFGFIGSVNARGRAWGFVTIALALLVNPTFLVLGLLTNPTWDIIGLLG